MLRAVFVLLAVGAFVAPIPAQVISAKALRDLLGADVKRYGNDDRLIVEWKLESEAELVAFDRKGAGSTVLAGRDGLVIDSGRGATGFSIRELRFTAPVTIAFRCRFLDPRARLDVELLDDTDVTYSTDVFLNTVFSDDPGRRHHFIGRRQRGAWVGRPIIHGPVEVGVRWLDVEIKVEKGTLSLAVGGRPLIRDEAFPHQSFRISFIAWDGRVALRDLGIDGLTVRESVRKLFRGATAAGKSAAVPAPEDLDGVWARLDEETKATRLSRGAVEALEALPESDRDACKRANERIKAGEARGALPWLEAVVASDGQAAFAQFLIGRAKMALGQAEDARQALECTVAGNPGFAEAWCLLAELHEERGAVAKALDCLEKAVSAAGDEPWIRVRRALALVRSGRIAEGIEDLDRAREQRPESTALPVVRRSLSRLLSRPEWAKPFRQENAYYEVESNVSAKLCVAWARQLLHYRRFLETAFPLPVKDGPRSRVWIFDSVEEYRLFSSTLGRRSEHTAGVYLPAIKTLLLFASTNPDETQDTLFHEAFHQYLDRAVSRPPWWFNEGLAEYFGATTFDPVSMKAVEGGLHNHRIGTLRVHLRRGGLVPLKDLMLMGPDAFMHEERAALHYAQSWALVHYFKRGGDARAKAFFDRYTEAILGGKSWDEAFSHAFADPAAADLTALEAGFKTYVTNVLLAKP